MVSQKHVLGTAKSVEGQGSFMHPLLVDLRDFVQEKPRPGGPGLGQGPTAN